jgi:hypothetical protein
MNPKTFIAFALGVFVAGGAAYFIGQSANKPAEPAAKPVVASQETPPPAPTETPVATNVPPEPAVAEPVIPKTPRKPKPAPYERPVAVAKSTPPAPAPAPVQQAQQQAPPTPAPVNQPLIVQDPPPPPPPSTPQHAATTPTPAPKPAPPEPPKANTVTIPAGTTLMVRLQEKLSSEKNQPGDSFQATLDQAVVVDGFIIAERGARVQGRITELDRSGKVKGRAKLVLELTQLNTSDGQRVRVQTSPFERVAQSTVKKDAMKVGIGAAIGAAIGGIAGGGKGAATGAGVGGAAGAGQVLLTRGEAAELGVETRLSFRLQEAVTLTEKLNN